jgi:acyl-CoA thioesterase I
MRISVLLAIKTKAILCAESGKERTPPPNGSRPSIRASYGFGVRLVQAAMLAIVALSSGLSAACAQTSRQINFVALGDSLTAGYGLPRDEAFPEALQRALRSAGWNVRVVNAGVSGDTVSDGLARLDWSVGKDADAVLVELGANDMLRGIDPAVTRKALDALLARLRARKIPAMLAGMYASPTLGREYVSAFQSIFPDLAQKYHIPLYPFFLKGVANEPNLQLGDGMHPNDKGVGIMVASILPTVESFLRAVSTQRED